MLSEQKGFYELAKIIWFLSILMLSGSKFHIVGANKENDVFVVTALLFLKIEGTVNVFLLLLLRNLVPGWYVLTTLSLKIIHFVEF